MADIISVYGKLLLEAMGQTLIMAFYSLIFASIIGLIFGMLSVLKSKVCNVIAQVFVDIIRGVPMIVLAFFVFFGVPYALKNFLHSTFTFTALQAGIICLSLNCGAYMSEIIRAEFSPLTSDRWRQQGVSEFPIGNLCRRSFFRRLSAR